VFCTFGYTNSFGIFQSYYTLERYRDQSSSTIAWIGSVQTFLQLTLAGVAGPLFDKGHFYPLMAVGSVVFIVWYVKLCLAALNVFLEWVELTEYSFFMISLADKFWQAFLAQGVGLGIGIGFLFLPAMTVSSQYFMKHRGIATGFVTTGSSIGGKWSK
jgi:MFS family permease